MHSALNFIKLNIVRNLFQPEDISQSDSDEEPSPEALARYLAMRRHTVGVGDSQHEAPEDVRVKLAHHQPIIAMPQPNLFMPFGFPPYANLPLNTMPMVPNPYHMTTLGGQHLLQLPQMHGQGKREWDMSFHLTFVMLNIFMYYTPSNFYPVNIPV